MHKWSEKENGYLKIGQGAEKILIKPGGTIPADLVTPQLLKRFGESIVEFEVVKEIPAPKSKKANK